MPKLNKKTLIAFFSVLMSISLTACIDTKEEAPAGETIARANVEKDGSEEREGNANGGLIKKAGPELINKANSNLHEILLPPKEKFHYTSPSSVLTSSMERFTLSLNLEDRAFKPERKPLNIYVETLTDKSYEQLVEKGYSKTIEGDREYLIAPNNRPAIAFKENGYLYTLDSVSKLMSNHGSTYSVQDLVTVAKNMTVSSDFKQYFEVSQKHYNLPGYFTNDGEEPYWLLVGYEDMSQPFDQNNQYLQISNNTLRFMQSNVRDSFEPVGKQIQINENLGYLEDSTFEMVINERLYRINLAASSINQDTGKVTKAEVQNYKEEIEKVVKSLEL